MEKITGKKPSLFSTIAIGVSCIIGSGWLFASYRASQFAGPISIVSWLIGAGLALMIALLLAEIASIYYTETGLFARLLSISHNRDYGFIISTSNWFSTIIAIPSEAEASMQYLSTAFQTFGKLTFVNGHFTHLGMVFVCLLMIFYGVLNYWGIRLLTKANNAVAILKVVIPIATACIILGVAFHPENFTSYHHTIAPYGFSRAFEAVVACGIFYSFYGFSMITVFAKELKNPQRNIPLALGISVVLCLGIYLLLQVAFIGALDPSMVKNGWHQLNFSSPLAQLVAWLGINWLALVLYVDAAISPSGTGAVYVGSSARMFTGMAHDKQMPAAFGREHPIYQVSRLSIVVILVFCMTLVVFFDSWSKLMIVVSVFQLLACLAVPIAFVKLRQSQADTHRPFRMPMGRVFSYVTYLTVCYLLVQCGPIPLLMSLLFHGVFFTIYCGVYYRDIGVSLKAFASSWSLFVFMGLITIAGYLQSINQLNSLQHMAVFLGVFSGMYYYLIHQKSYHGSEEKNPI